MKYLLNKEEDYSIKSFKNLEANALKSLTNELRLKILNELKKEPMYPNQLAKKLGIHEQKVYYHINELKKAGVLEVVRKEEIKGSIANYYGVSADSFGIELEGDYEKINIKEDPDLKKFFKEFINKQGFFEGLIVVGSPLPHGPYKATARDGHYAAQVSALIGSVARVNKFMIKLDTDVINEKLLTENLVIIGGPGTNLVTAQFNNHLPISFNEKNYWTSLKSGSEEYTGDSTGLVIKMPNPLNNDKTIIVLAGLRVIGTKSSIIALMNKEPSICKEGRVTQIIKGFDFKGDGKIDGVEIIE